MLKTEVIPIVSHKIDDRIGRYEADYRGKMCKMDNVLTDYMKEANHEFLVKPSPYRTKEEIQQIVGK